MCVILLWLSRLFRGKEKEETNCCDSSFPMVAAHQWEFNDLKKKRSLLSCLSRMIFWSWLKKDLDSSSYSSLEQWVYQIIREYIIVSSWLALSGRLNGLSMDHWQCVCMYVTVFFSSSISLETRMCHQQKTRRSADKNRKQALKFPFFFSY